MLSARKIPEVLGSVLTDGLEGACLMSSEGSLLCSVNASQGGTQVVSDTSLAAISSSVWSNYQQGSPDLSFALLRLENGFLGVVTAGKGYLISAYGRDVTPGLLRGKLESLSSHFERVFDTLEVRK
jgi:hypothetical protein